MTNTAGRQCVCGGSLTSYNQRNHQFCNVVEPQEVNLTMTLAHKPECSLLQPVRSTNTEQKSCDCGYEGNLAYVEYQNMTINRLTSQLATIERETAEECAEIADKYDPDERSIHVDYASSSIRTRFNLKDKS